MTYSEVREMYSMDALVFLEKKDRTRRRVSLLFSWLIPWTMSMMILILGIDSLNARNIMISILLLPLSYSLFVLVRREDMRVRIMFIFFSYLVTLSFLLTVILC